MLFSMFLVTPLLGYEPHPFSPLCQTHKINQVNNTLSNCRSLPALCSSVISIYQSPHFNNPPCPVSLPMFINRSMSLNNSDQVNWPQLGSHCISAILLFITCWLPIAFLAAAVPNISALLKSLIPALQPPLLALNLTSYWENWNHPNISLHHCPPFLLRKKSLNLSLIAFGFTWGNGFLCRETALCSGG